MRSSIIVIVAIALSYKAVAQSPVPDSVPANLNDKALHRISTKYSKLTNDVNQKTVTLLQQMQKREAKLNAKLQGIDSVKAAALFTGSQEKYQQLQAQLQAPLNTNIPNPLRDYLPGLDSTQTTFRFLSQAGLPADKMQQIQGISTQIQSLQNQLQQANEIQAFLKDREAQLQTQLSQYNMGGQLLGINKQIYYYQQQISQYKALLRDPQKLEETILAQAMKMPAFQSFFQRNSYLSQLFGLPADYGSPASLAGLQTRAQLQQLISQRIGTMQMSGAGNNAAAFTQQQMQNVQGQLSQMQNNVANLAGVNGSGGGGNSNLVMPDFHPNQEKTKPFLKRLEYGFNIQTTQATNLAPSYSDIAATIGYKVSDKASTGVGLSYKLGVGRPIDHIQFSSEGVGLRYYLDIKAKGGLWLTGGAEYNYLQSFSKLSDLNRNVSAWQKSALLGLTKKYSIGKTRQGNLQLLYDFLHNQHIPITQALIFRMGYSF